MITVYSTYFCDENHKPIKIHTYIHIEKGETPHVAE